MTHIPAPALECLNQGPDCDGPVEYRMALSGTSNILCITVQQDRDAQMRPLSRWSVLLTGTESQEAPVEGVHKERALEIAMAIRKHAGWAEFLVEGDSSTPGLHTAAKTVVEVWKTYVAYNHDIGVELRGHGELMDAIHRLARYVS